MNNNFRKALNEYIDSDKLSKDIIKNFCFELKFSNLFAPAMVDGKNITYYIDDSDGGTIELFTDIDEFKMSFKGSKFEAHKITFSTIVELYLNQNISLIHFNSSTENFIMSCELLQEIIDRNLYHLKIENEKFNLDIDKMVFEYGNIFLNKSMGYFNGDYDELILELSKTFILNIIFSDTDLDFKAKNDVICLDDEVLKIPIEENGGLIYTDMDLIKRVYNESEDGVYPYLQIIRLIDVVDYCLYHDCNHILINEKLSIPRKLWIKHYEMIKIFARPRFDGRKYAFIIHRNMAADKYDDLQSKGYDVKVRLDDFRPLTWRDLIIPSGITFKDLDNILKILWDFFGYHLSQFTFKNSYDVITAQPSNPSHLKSDETIIDIYFENNDKIYWEYDFREGWSFTIEVKKVVEFNKDYPIIKRFKGDYNPQDNIGGVWGLERLMNENPDELFKFDKDYIQYSLKNYDCED